MTSGTMTMSSAVPCRHVPLSGTLGLARGIVRRREDKMILLKEKLQ
jgi:hypothetical protein